MRPGPSGRAAACLITDAQVATFRDRGLLRLPAALPADAVAQAQSAVFAVLERAGLWAGGAWRLEGADRPRWPALGKAPAAFKGRAVTDALEALVPEALRPDLSRLSGAAVGTAGGLHRPQVLWTLPNADAWSLPSILWHTDVPRAPQAGCPGVQVFSFLSPVAPGAGATLVAAGSHRLLNDQGELRSKEIKARLRTLPPFARLMDPAHPDRPAAPGPLGEADGVPIEVVELTGDPGDLWLMDMRALHTAAPNASKAPRLMMTWRFLREG
jgi:hypothetical protein